MTPYQYIFRQVYMDLTIMTLQPSFLLLSSPSSLTATVLLVGALGSESVAIIMLLGKNLVPNLLMIFVFILTFLHSQIIIFHIKHNKHYFSKVSFSIKINMSSTNEVDSNIKKILSLKDDSKKSFSNKR